METLKKPLSIKVIYWITNITFWIYVVVSILAIALSVVFLFNLLPDNNLQLHVGMPVAVNILEKGTLDLNIASNYMDVQFKEMYGKIHFIDTPASVAKVYSIFILTITGAFFYIFLIFRRFINNVYDGKYFDIDNIALLKRISYALVGVWIFTAVYSYFQYFFIAINLKFETITTTGDVQTYPLILLGALFIWVLSHIFQKGVELKYDNELTI